MGARLTNTAIQAAGGLSITAGAIAGTFTGAFEYRDATAPPESGALESRAGKVVGDGRVLKLPDSLQEYCSL